MRRDPFEEATLSLPERQEDPAGPSADAGLGGQAGSAGAGCRGLLASDGAEGGADAGEETDEYEPL